MRIAMALTSIEAKDRCIQIWEYLEKHITDDAWRTNVMMTYRDPMSSQSENMKRYALLQLYPVDSPNSQCYLCEYHRIIQAHGEWKGCMNCCLSRGESGYGTAPCLYGRRPYASFVLNVKREQWARAARAAHRLVALVKQWNPEED